MIARRVKNWFRRVWATAGARNKGKATVKLRKNSLLRNLPLIQNLFVVHFQYEGYCWMVQDEVLLNFNYLKSQCRAVKQFCYYCIIWWKDTPYFKLICRKSFFLILIRAESLGKNQCSQRHSHIHSQYWWYPSFQDFEALCRRQG